MGPGRKNERGFTLIELMAVIVIILLLGTFAMPAWQKVIDKAQSQACAVNLREIGIAIQLAVQDNSGFYPNIEPDPTMPIYLEEDNAQTLAEVLEPYGVAAKTLKCPADAANNNYFAQKGTSYEWRPLVDGEPAASPKLIFRRGMIIRGSPSRIRLVTDFDAVHHGRQNGVFADGHVKAY
jgi:prepilin-type N-terminal cleavage/methylation domain-containing protein/prepilin-type processing-associated H-X9-DG protein